MIVALELHFPVGTKAKRGRCMGCGCTHARACEGGCSWVHPSRLLCSACLDAVCWAVQATNEPVEISSVSADGGEFVSLTMPLGTPPTRSRTRASKGR